MTKKQQLLNEVLLLNHEISTLQTAVFSKQRDKEIIRNKIAELDCHFKIDDKLKMQNYPDKKAIVEKITMGINNEPKIRIRKFKNNGIPYINLVIAEPCHK